MQDPCRACPRKELDFGGCRCQAFQLTGDAAATDPVCALAPGRPLIDAAVAESDGEAAYVYRDYRQADASSGIRTSVTR
jgi:pyrroloquinoline quinone biosynthesis protein E